MGLDASVMCDCFRSRLTTEPPVPRDWLHVDEEGYLNLKPGHDSDGAFAVVYDWMQTCCGHPGHAVRLRAHRQLGGLSALPAGVGRGRVGQFPVLHGELPEANGGMTEAAGAALALGELAVFRSLGEIGSNPCLVDTATGEVVQEHVAGYGGVFILDGEFRARSGVRRSTASSSGRARASSNCFRASRFRQEILDPDADPYGPEPWRVVYADLDSGREFECRFAVPGETIPWPDGRMQDDRGRCRFRYPEALHVEVRAVRSRTSSTSSAPWSGSSGRRSRRATRCGGAERSHGSSHGLARRGDEKGDRAANHERFPEESSSRDGTRFRRRQVLE